MRVAWANIYRIGNICIVIKMCIQLLYYKMHKNRLVELTNMTPRSERLGSKIKLPENFRREKTQFDQIQIIIDQLMHNNDEINELRKRHKKTADPHVEKQILNNVNQLTEHNRTLMNKIEKNIKQINQNYKKEIQAGNKTNTLEVNRITQKANKAIIEFRQYQQKFSNQVKDNIRRQAIIIQGDISEQQVQDIMTNPEKGQQMLRAKLLNEPSAQLQNAVSDIIDKYNDILLLQKTMHECLQMMQDLALLVALTGEQIDNIQNLITGAEDYTKQGQASMGKAKELHKSSKKKMCCIMVLLMALIAVVVIPILITKL